MDKRDKQRPEKGVWNSSFWCTSLCYLDLILFLSRLMMVSVHIFLLVSRQGLWLCGGLHRQHLWLGGHDTLLCCWLHLHHLTASHGALWSSGICATAQGRGGPSPEASPPAKCQAHAPATNGQGPSHHSLPQPHHPHSGESHPDHCPTHLSLLEAFPHPANQHLLLSSTLCFPTLLIWIFVTFLKNYQPFWINHFFCISYYLMIIRLSWPLQHWVHKTYNPVFLKLWTKTISGSQNQFSMLWLALKI